MAIDISSMNTFDLSYDGTFNLSYLATYTPDDFCKTSPRAWFTVGDWAPGGYSTPQGHVLVVRAPASDPSALVRPVGMTMNWTNKKGSGTHGARQGGLFSPICPTGYGYLGSVGVYHDGILDPSVVTPDTFPSLMCVSETYLRANDAAHQPALKWVWDAQGSGCDYTGSVWAQPDLARPDGNLIFLPFVAGAHDSYDAPAVPYSLNTSKVVFQPPLARCSPPEQNHSSEHAVTSRLIDVDTMMPMAPQDLPWGDWAPPGVIQLPIRVLPGGIEVSTAHLDHLHQLSLGLFLRAGLEAFSDDDQSSLSCTAAAVAWRCLSNTPAQAEVVVLPQPEWRGSYVVLALAEDCTPHAASEAFFAGPLPRAGSTLIELISVNTTWRPWSVGYPTRCLELSSVSCHTLTIHVSGRREAHTDDAVALFPVTAAAVVSQWDPNPRGRASAALRPVRSRTPPLHATHLCRALTEWVWIPRMAGRRVAAGAQEIQSVRLGSRTPSRLHSTQRVVDPAGAIIPCAVCGRADLCCRPHRSRSLRDLHSWPSAPTRWISRRWESELLRRSGNPGDISAGQSWQDSRGEHTYSSEKCHQSSPAHAGSVPQPYTRGRSRR